MHSSILVKSLSNKTGVTRESTFSPKYFDKTSCTDCKTLNLKFNIFRKDFILHKKLTLGALLIG